MEAEDTNFESEPELEPLRIHAWGYAEDVDITNREFQGEEQVCVAFHAECGHTGAEVPLVDILKHALVDHPEIVAQAFEELGREVPEGLVESDSDEPDDESGGWSRYG